MKLSRLFHTTRHLKLKQIAYRLYYLAHKPVLKPLKQPLIRQWQQNWNAPLVMPSSMSDSGAITFLNETGQLEMDCLWSNPERSKLWLYNLHYFDDLNAQDAGSRTALAQSLIQKWIDENPSLQGHGWESYPLSLRMINWIKWFSRYPELVQTHWLDSLAMQADALNKQIEYHILGNHLFANAKALVFVGCYFDGQQANRWLMKGLRILNREVVEQFLPDGGHYERSPMYHATLLWDMCDLVQLAEQSKNQALLTRKELWLAVIERGLDWLSCMVHPDGDISFFNDAAFGIAPALADLIVYACQLRENQPEKNDEPVSLYSNILLDVPRRVRGIQRSACETRSLDPADTPRDIGRFPAYPVAVQSSRLGPAACPRDPEISLCSWISGSRGQAAGPRHAVFVPQPDTQGSFDLVENRVNNTVSMKLLKDSGYCIINTGNNGKAILDVAKIGPDYQPGHAHADTLSFELSLYGQRFLVNSGTSQYGEDAQRSYQRSTKAHNTVCIDGKNSSEVWAGFRVAQRAYPHDLSWRINSSHVFIGCAHNGYERLLGRNTHYREWTFSQDKLIIHDVISGRFSDAEARYYFHPDVHVIKQEAQSVMCCLPGGQEIVVKLEGASDLRMESSCWYPYFGVSIQNTCLIASFRESVLKTQITW